jgi:NAD(P)-dependent dehydrogenase (short-subunit alcohol dehydrogenase family)
VTRSSDSASDSNSRPVAIVTGASSGIGEASARALAGAGFDVVMAARRLERLEVIAKEISEAGGRATPLPVDLADEEATSDLVRETLALHGRIDVLLNNAGYSPAGALEHMSRGALRHAFDVNLLSALQLIAEVSPIMRKQGSGRIINMGSVAGTIGAPLAIPYSTTKAGLDAATRGLRLELAPWKIHVSLIIPGFVDTAVFDNTREAASDLREDPENPWRQLFFDLDEFAAKQLAKALSPSDVGKIVVEAATARRPRLRYWAPLSVRLQSGFMAMLPERWVDAILLKVYGIERA